MSKKPAQGNATDSGQTSAAAPATPAVTKPARKSTATSEFGAGKRESHDASAFYARFTAPEISDNSDIAPMDERPSDHRCLLGDARDMRALPDNSVALVVTSPPYFVGKEYELAVLSGDDGADDPGRGVPASYLEYLEMLRDVFAECVRVLEPGGRIAVNVANLGRKPYRSLSSDVIRILQDELHLLLRGELIWQKGKGSSGSCAWGSFKKASNPVLRDITERVVVASKGRFDRALSVPQRKEKGFPWKSSLTNDEFLETTRDVWEIDAESARRVGHPAPFPIELPRRLIELYTYEGDLVLDPFLGAGTSVVAAERTGRIGIGFDLDPDYVTLAEDRLDADKGRFAGLKAVTGVQESLLDSLEDPALLHEFEGIEEHERQEYFQARAVSEGKKAQDIAKNVLEATGFIVEEKAKTARGGVQYNFIATAEADPSVKFFVDVSGAFTTSRPGLMRTDTLWKTLGRAHVVASLGDDDRLPVLVLTSNIPKPKSEGDRALRSVGPDGIFDVIEMLNVKDLARLRHYSSTDITFENGRPVPLPSFWTEEAVEDFISRVKKTGGR